MHSNSSFTRWITRLFIKLFSATPSLSSAAILLSLFSQVALMVGTLLPIKVIMLLGVPAVPDYIPPPFNSLNKETLTLVLASLSVVIFITYLVSDKLCSRIIHTACDTVVAQTGKVILFENQDDLARNAYQRIVSSTAGLLFSSIVIAVLTIIYPILCLALLAFTFVCLPISRWFLIKSRELQSPPLFNRTIQNLNNLSFLLCFSVIVIHHLYFTAPSILLTIIAVILCRQCASKLCSATIDLADIANKKDKISAIFLEDHLLVSQTPKNSSLLGMMERESRDTWLPEILKHAEWHINHPQDLSIQWLQTTIGSVFALWVFDKTSERSCIVKLFDINRKNLALHEASLLTSSGIENLPTPKLIYSGALNGFSIHLLETDGFSPAIDRAKFGELSETISAALAHWPFPADLREAYLKSHPLLWQKLEARIFDPVLVAASPQDSVKIRQIQRQIPNIQKALSTLPVCLHNPNITPRTILEKDNIAIAYHWGSWSLDILGTQYPPTIQGLKLLRGVIETSEFDLNPALPETAGFFASLLQHAQQQRYLDVLELLPELIRRLETLSLYSDTK